MAKLVLSLAMLLAIFFTCFSIVESQQIHPLLGNSKNIALSGITNATQGNASNLSSLADINTTELIPREILFGNPERTGVLISPDGKWISYSTALRGVLNVWIAPVDNISNAKPVTNDTSRGVKSYFWAFTNHHIVYRQDTNGDENWHIYAVNITSNETKDLTPFKNISAYVQEVSYKFPQEILVAINDRNPEYHEIYRINITTGETHLVQKNDVFADFMTDSDFRVRFATNVTTNGDEDIFKPAANGSWEKFMKIKYEDSTTTGPIIFDRTGDILYMAEGRGRNTAAIESLNLVTGEVKVLAEDPRVDPGMMMVHPVEKTIQAVDFNYDRQNWTILDKSIKPDIDYLHKVADGDVAVYARTQDDSRWIVVYIVDNGPARYYLYNRTAKTATFLFSANKAQENLPLSKMHFTVIKSRDGLNLASYYTLPIWADKNEDGLPEMPLPMVLLVHGGPGSRDAWGFSALNQLLSNRGYAVLSVNFRGSTGFGKNLTNSGDREWGRKMQYDLLDAVNWSTELGIADPEKVAIMGGSYGGYAALAGMTFSPEVFACGVDICGPSNLTSMLLSIPPYWKPALEMELKRIGDYRTEEGRKLLQRSVLLFYMWII